ncbi:hypothetical protein F5148DRAFT_1285501 [Russula earlei]|uniref:Uncharacterized protein n=1 Tax=Russula earlei TaxID=71964 RepID=A0ACC0U6B1_9AGAM|nr:hypothetical protein F5148DRAFT_1285501 [Russula earlei]
MRTSAIVAFISLVMGVAPSFSLPLISVRSNPSGGSDDRRHGRTSQNDSQKVPPTLYAHYSEPGNPDRGISLPIHLDSPPDMEFVGTGHKQIFWGPAYPSRPKANANHQNANHQNANPPNANPPNANPPNTSRKSSPTPQEREANHGA